MATTKNFIESSAGPPTHTNSETVYLNILDSQLLTETHVKRQCVKQLKEEYVHWSD